MFRLSLFALVMIGALVYIDARPPRVYPPIEQPYYRMPPPPALDSDIQKAEYERYLLEQQFLNGPMDPSDFRRSELDELRRLSLQRSNSALREKRMRDEFARANGNNRPMMPPPSRISDDTYQKIMLEERTRVPINSKKEQDLFLEHEMKKKYEQQELLKHMTNETLRKAEEERIRIEHEKRRHHAKINEPMHADHVKDVWENRDHMEPAQFDPHTFFFMHDLDGNGMWDEQEITTVLMSELRKSYPANATYDAVEFNEEIRRMLNSVFDDIDTDKDRYISLDEFIAATKDHDFTENKGWEDIEEHGDEFTNQQLEQYKLEHPIAYPSDELLHQNQNMDNNLYHNVLPAGAQHSSMENSAPNLQVHSNFVPVQHESQPVSLQVMEHQNKQNPMPIYHDQQNVNVGEVYPGAKNQIPKAQEHDKLSQMNAKLPLP